MFGSHEPPHGRLGDELVPRQPTPVCPSVRHIRWKSRGRRSGGVACPGQLPRFESCAFNCSSPCSQTAVSSFIVPMRWQARHRNLALSRTAKNTERTTYPKAYLERCDLTSDVRAICLSRESCRSGDGDHRLTSLIQLSIVRRISVGSLRRFA